jgi:hypothetical protein
VARPERPAEGGSTLLLMPAAVLIVIVLGAISVDFAIVFLAERELSNATAAAANDAAGAAVAEEPFYRSGEVRIDAAVARRVAEEAMAARRAEYLRDVTVDVEVAGGRLAVAVTARVGYVFARAIPGAPHSAAVQARSVASAEQG